ncbi:histidine kinase [Cellulomonas sp.]|uniref:sensor histidine kinase n=1 Tax=Cellulomonas sp. TaxID=40001 RepID=UPI001B033B96|nr:histidine kinase [Cellulomonas sp.]MBO9554502.1 histidine kinase [Cellulomonas sp.]
MTTLPQPDCPPGTAARVPLASVVPALAGLAVLTGLATWTAITQGSSAVPAAVDVAVGLLSLGALLLVRDSPLPAGLLLGALAAVSPAATPAATAGTLVAGRLHPVRLAWPVAAASAVGHAVQAMVRPPGMLVGWWLLCDVAVHAALLGWGAYARTRAELVAAWRERAVRAEREQARRVDEARMAERTRIAREMHDTLAHRLSLLATTAGALEYRPDLTPDQVAHAAGVVRASAGEALAELREVIGLLRSGPDELRPVPGVGDLGALVEESRLAGTDVVLSAPDDLDVPAAVGLAVYRACQEGLTNARRHAPGSRVRIDVTRSEDGVAVRVDDRGGTRGRRSADGSGTGLVGLAERVELLGGHLDAGPTEDGFVLTASVPWSR